MKVTNAMQAYKVSEQAKEVLQLALRALNAGMMEEAVRLRQRGEYLNACVFEWVSKQPPPNLGPPPGGKSNV